MIALCRERIEQLRRTLSFVRNWPFRIMCVGPIAAVLAPLLSIVTFAGVPFCPIALPKKRRVALAIPSSRQQEVHRGRPPALSTALYRYSQVPRCR